MTDYDPYGRGGDPVPKRGKRNAAPEWKTQAAIYAYYIKRCRLDKHLRETTRLFASLNEGQRTPQRAAIAKMMGMVPGAPWDLTLIRKCPRQGLPPLTRILWIEVKSPVGKLSDAQKAWALWLGGTGIETRVVRSVAEFEKILEGL